MACPKQFYDVVKSLLTCWDDWLCLSWSEYALWYRYEGMQRGKSTIDQMEFFTWLTKETFQESEEDSWMKVMHMK